jgi:hypothetical protein
MHARVIDGCIGNAFEEGRAVSVRISGDCTLQRGGCYSRLSSKCLVCRTVSDNLPNLKRYV